MRAILTQVRAAILRRRAQTATVLIITIMALRRSYGRRYQTRFFHIG